MSLNRGTPNLYFRNGLNARRNPKTRPGELHGEPIKYKCPEEKTVLNTIPTGQGVKSEKAGASVVRRRQRTTQPEVGGAKIRKSRTNEKRANCPKQNVTTPTTSLPDRYHGGGSTNGSALQMTKRSSGVPQRRIFSHWQRREKRKGPGSATK